MLIELIDDLLPPGVLNIVNGFGVEAGKPLASSNRVAKVAFTGETTTGRLIMQYASENIIPVTLELGGKSPNVFFDDVASSRDDFYDKALEGFTMFALNQGEVCTCPSRALIQSSIYDSFLADAMARTEAIKLGNPLDTDTMMGAQASNDQYEKILAYLDIGRAEGAEVSPVARRPNWRRPAGGYYIQPTIFEGDNKMRIFQEEIFGPVVSVTKFDDYADAMKIANDTLYGLGAGVWSRDINTAYRAGREIQAGRVWTNYYHAYPAHAAFGGYKNSGIGRENHKMMLDHYQQTKNLLVSYSPIEARLLLSPASRMVEKVLLTDAAAEWLRRLTEMHGPLMFHQSGGCCDGSSPMCYPDGEFITGSADVHLGDLVVDGLDDPIGFWMSANQYEYWKHTQLTVDVVKGRGSGFSVEAPEGVRFLIRSRLFTDKESAELGLP